MCSSDLELKIAYVDKEVHVGPIMYVAKAFDTTPEKAVKWVILTIIFVFDPLAIALLIAGNFLLALKKDPPLTVVEPPVDGSRHVDSSNGDVYRVHDGMLMKEDPPGIEEFEAPPQPTIQELTDKEDNRAFSPLTTEPEREKVVIKPPKPRPPKVKVEMRDDKEVIKIDRPLRSSSLESLHADADFSTKGISPSKMKGEYQGD